jgi:hypothetical protein
VRIAWQSDEDNFCATSHQIRTTVGPRKSLKRQENGGGEVGGAQHAPSV